jgi:hypothetical protein
MVAISQCGATLNQSCPPSCVQPQLTFVAKLHVRAGLNMFTNQDTMLNKATSNANVAQAFAEVQYCTTTLTPTEYTTMLLQECKLTPEQYNAAISAAWGVSGNTPSSSQSSPAPSASKPSASPSSNATGSAAVLAINTLVNGLALVLIVMFATGF